MAWSKLFSSLKFLLKTYKLPELRRSFEQDTALKH
jgi:hypothetical protein